MAYTEAMQTAVLVIGSALVSVFGLAALGGWHQQLPAGQSAQVAVVAPQQAEATGFGSAMAKGWGRLRKICGSEMFNLWKPMVPKGMEATWAPVNETKKVDTPDASQKEVRAHGVVFQHQLPVAQHAVLCAGDWFVVLVH